MRTVEQKFEEITELLNGIRPPNLRRIKLEIDKLIDPNTIIPATTPLDFMGELSLFIRMIKVRFTQLQFSQAELHRLQSEIEEKIAFATPERSGTDSETLVERITSRLKEEDELRQKIQVMLRRTQA